VLEKLISQFMFDKAADGEPPRPSEAGAKPTQSAGHLAGRTMMKNNSKANRGPVRGAARWRSASA
jgi:hypothetical protein